MSRLVHAIGLLLRRIDWELSWDWYATVATAGLWRVEEDGNRWDAGTWTWFWWRERCDRWPRLAEQQRRVWRLDSRWLPDMVARQRTRSWWDRLGWQLERLVVK